MTTLQGGVFRNVEIYEDTRKEETITCLAYREETNEDALFVYAGTNDGHAIMIRCRKDGSKGVEVARTKVTSSSKRKLVAIRAVRLVLDAFARRFSR